MTEHEPSAAKRTAKSAAACGLALPGSSLVCTKRAGHSGGHFAWSDGYGQPRVEEPVLARPGDRAKLSGNGPKDMPPIVGPGSADATEVRVWEERDPDGSWSPRREQPTLAEVRMRDKRRAARARRLLGRPS
jgi:hypothetical protein